VPLAALRLVVTVHALAAFAQPVLAGQFLSGNFDMVAVHGAVAILVQLLGLVQVPVAVLLRWPGRGPLWPVWVSGLLFLAESAQAAFGYTRLLSAHIPLGTTIAGGLLLLLVWVWRPRLGVPAESGEEAGSHAPVAP
jgi:hypothetical protein